MITYELALELKKAGFPFKYHDPFYINGKYEREIKDPTLSELIEACGDIALTISACRQVDGRIYAVFDIEDKHGNKLDFCLHSLEEIFAMLWLELKAIREML
jgi:hypothetical protein